MPNVGESLPLCFGIYDKVSEEQGQRCTPLLIAARNGKENVIKMLLSKFKPDIEQEGDVKFDGYLIEGASPLWCAAGTDICRHLSFFTRWFVLQTNVFRMQEPVT